MTRREPSMDTSTETWQPLAAKAPGEAAGAILVAFAGQRFGGSDWQTIAPAGTVIGRKTLRLDGVPIDDPLMSRNHARIDRRAGEAWTVEDLGSRNGTFRNGRRIQGSERLEPGDVVQIGGTIAIFSQWEPDLRAAPAADPDMVGQSVAVRAVREQVGLVAGRDVSVLITGETGVGKEVVAEAIHRRSARTGAFVAVNCGGLAEGLLESELFGHARGAFTSATGSRPGLFAAAERGTLFLDEVGETPAALQVKLLRVLETRKVRPVGEAREHAVDVRVVAATNRDVVDEVRAGRFRADLFARLGQWRIHVPALRERREDLPLLVRHFLDRSGAGSQPVDLALAKALLLHAWPLNVRGLRNVISMAVVSSEGEPIMGLHPRVEETLAAERALGAVSSVVSPAVEKDPVPSSAPSAPARPPPTFAEAEVESVLRAVRGNVAEAARRLGCSRQQFYRVLEAYRIDPARFRRISSDGG
jgi:DNA-binding NtrC family response regulator